MTIGVPKEIKKEEYRVALTPEGTKVLVSNGHKLMVETQAGEGSGFLDKEYKNAGAEILASAKEVWNKSEMIMKVKEPQESEFEFLKPGLILFTYLHLAAFPKLTKILQEKNVISICYATVELEDGSLPLLKPMSEVAGKLAIQMGARFLEKRQGGAGILLGGTEIVPAANVVVLGAGTVGSNAAETALGMGANVVLIDINLKKLEAFKNKVLDSASSAQKGFGKKLTTLQAPIPNLNEILKNADLLIGGVLVAGAKAPKLVNEEQVKQMKKGAVIVDVAIDQGGCIETSCPTTHDNPVFEKHGVIHYCVANMPGTVPRTSTLALTQATLPYALELANKGFIEAVKNNSALRKGINVYKSKITHPKLAEAFNESFVELKTLLE